MENRMSKLEDQVVELETRIAVVESNIEVINKRLDTIKNNSTWILRLIVGAIVMAVLDLVIKGLN
ncbi:MAG: hemolysin XhlA family protein [Bacillota bacterium]|nr:hemolysin XhlA family protein [Bacillota bacterium]